MGKIHVNTDVMRDLGNRFIAWNDKLRNEVEPELRNLSGHLENDWRGLSRDHYDHLIQEWEQYINNFINSGEELGHHLTNTAQQFEEADNS